jgi:tetratricopeptide (TPR) repeat protein
MAQRQWSQAAAAYGLAARMDSRNAQYRRGLADALLASGQYDRAKGEYTTLANAGDASAKLGVARCLAALGDDPGANAAYNDYLKAFPNDGTAKQELQELLGQ